MSDFLRPKGPGPADMSMEDYLALRETEMTPEERALTAGLERTDRLMQELIDSFPEAERQQAAREMYLGRRQPGDSVRAATQVVATQGRPRPHAPLGSEGCLAPGSAPVRELRVRS